MAALLTFLVALAGMSSCQVLGWAAPEKGTGKPVTIAFGVDLSVISGPVWVAENKGYFREEGLDVRIVDYPSGRTALTEMANKENLDMVTVAQTPVMYNSFSKGNYAIVAGFAYSWDDVLLLARRDKGIAAPADLRGKRIGTPAGSSGHFFLNQLLVDNGLSLSDVTVVDIDAPDLPKALSDGMVEAISIWQPYINNARKLLREEALLLPSKNVYREDFYIVPRREFIRNKPEALKQFLRALDRAETFIRGNREEAIDVVARRLGLDGETVASFWDGYRFELFLDETILADLQAEARWALMNGYAVETQIPDYVDFIYANALESLKPEAVKIIR